MVKLFIPDAVRAELVEALPFLCTVRSGETQPFDRLRANGAMT